MKKSHFDMHVTCTQYACKTFPFSFIYRFFLILYTYSSKASVKILVFTKQHKLSLTEQVVNGTIHIKNDKLSYKQKRFAKG